MYAFYIAILKGRIIAEISYYSDHTAVVKYKTGVRSIEIFHSYTQMYNKLMNDHKNIVIKRYDVIFQEHISEEQKPVKINNNLNAPRILIEQVKINNNTPY